MREEEHGEQSRQRLSNPCPAESWGSSPASSRAQGPSRSSSCQDAHGLLPREFQ